MKWVVEGKREEMSHRMKEAEGGDSLKWASGSTIIAFFPTLISYLVK